MTSMTPEEFISSRGLTIEMLEQWADETLVGCQSSDVQDSSDSVTAEVIGLAAEMIEAGAALPPLTARLVSEALRDLADGIDPRTRLGLNRGRGAPVDPRVAERHAEASACLELLRLAAVPKSHAVELVARAVPMSVRNVWDLETMIAAGELSEPHKTVSVAAQRRYLATVAMGKDGKGVLRRLLEDEPKDEPKYLRDWRQFRDFLSVIGDF